MAALTGGRQAQPYLLLPRLLSGLWRSARPAMHRGSFGWALRTQNINVAHYKYFVFMNSSARGPFLPSYFPNNLHWTHPLVSRLRKLVKLVGPTISCEGERQHHSR